MELLVELANSSPFLMSCRAATVIYETAQSFLGNIETEGTEKIFVIFSKAQSLQGDEKITLRYLLQTKPRCTKMLCFRDLLLCVSLENILSSTNLMSF